MAPAKCKIAALPSESGVAKVYSMRGLIAMIRSRL